jgi:hypothetical protein
MSEPNLSTQSSPRELTERQRDARASRIYADQWLADHKALVATFPIRTAIVICVATGEYVTAPTRVDALVAFERRFGQQAQGFLHEVGHRTFVGGGIA